jgi:hypothetical protein
MSYSFNYKALWLYYKTKAFTLVMLSSNVLMEVMITTKQLGFSCLKTVGYVHNYTYWLK